MATRDGEDEGTAVRKPWPPMLPYLHLTQQGPSLAELPARCPEASPHPLHPATGPGTPKESILRGTSQGRLRNTPPTSGRHFRRRHRRSVRLVPAPVHLRLSFLLLHPHPPTPPPSEGDLDGDSGAWPSLAQPWVPWASRG